MLLVEPFCGSLQYIFRGVGGSTGSGGGALVVISGPSVSLSKTCCGLCGMRPAPRYALYKDIFLCIGSLASSHKHRQEVSFVNCNISESNKMIHLFSHMPSGGERINRHQVVGGGG